MFVVLRRTSYEVKFQILSNACRGVGTEGEVVAWEREELTAAVGGFLRGAGQLRLLIVSLSIIHKCLFHIKLCFYS